MDSKQSESDEPSVEHVRERGASADVEKEHVLTIQEEATQDAERVSLSWRSWVVVFITSFAVLSQIFSVVSAPSVIAFIVRDLGDAGVSGWVISGPLLIQSVLSPSAGRLSDVLNRKYLAAVPPLIAFAGSIVSAKATSMGMLIGGSLLISTTLATIGIVQAITAEILPLKFRALASLFSFAGGVIGGLIGSLGAGALTNLNAGGWRNIFWIQAVFHGATSLGLFLFYWPPKTQQYAEGRVRDYIWACDPIGSAIFVCGATILLLGLNWAGGSYAWSDPHVAVPLALGLALFIAFAGYEWRGRSDGLLAHVFFRGNANFALSIFAFTVEGWIYYSAVNAIVPQMVLHLGFETDAWKIAVRQLSYVLPTLFASIPIAWYATAFKDLKTPLIVTFSLFLVASICYAVIKPTWNKAQIGFGVIAGIGQAGPLVLLVACIQFTAPHAYLSTATGLAFSARAIGGAFGTAVLDAIINGHLNANYASAVGNAAVEAGLPPANVGDLLTALASGVLSGVPGATPAVWAAATEESKWQYARAYQLAWASIIPFVVVATAAVAFLRGVKELMTDEVEATVEHVVQDPESPEK